MMELYVTARFHAREGLQDELAAALRTLVGAARTDPGCLAMKAFGAIRDSRLFFIHSYWADEAAFAAHMELTHAVRFSQSIAPLIDHELEVVPVRPIGWTA
ncbi:MAG TPA: antibiotic biosynthesis monooxygenase family protein [Acetobacteraceae bacterium]|jgi:quinol monooxygenase YgiN